MIKISDLTDLDVGRNVVYHREFYKKEFGKLSGWNSKYIFVRFKGQKEEGCDPSDVSFEGI